MAELHGGTLTAESTVGEGSRFVVALPVVKPDGEVGEARPAGGDVVEVPPHPLDGAPDAYREADEAKPVILVVEDNADVRGYLRSSLEADFMILEAEDGMQGLEAARKHEPDLVLADVMMPNMDGYEMCRLIKANQNLRHIPVVMLTAKASEGETVEGLKSGADDYLSKPFSVAELRTRVSNLVATRRELRDAYSREVFVRPAGITITSEDEVFLEQVLDVINERMGDSNLTVDWLADEVGLSRRQLHRRVEAVSGQSPGNLIRRLRMERASQLLRAKAGTVSEIGYAVGFRSPAHFSKAFRQAWGESPTEHMRRTELSKG
jgi:DNA-binding response OmpR family regulator